MPIPYSFKLNFRYTNNNVEYEALIIAIKIAIKLKVKRVKFVGDSLLIVNKVKGVLQCKESLLQKYRKLVDSLIQLFEKYELEVAPRSTNRFIDAKASIGSLIPQDPYRCTIHIKVVQIVESFLNINDELYEVLDITIEDKKL